MQVGLAIGIVLMGIGGLAAGEVRASGLQKILCWNIRAGRGMDRVLDISRTAAFIRQQDADVIALQEVDRRVARSGGVDQLAVLAQATGRVGTWCKTIDLQGGEYGIALLSRTHPLRVQRIVLPNAEKGEPRKLLLAEFADYWIGVTHLPLEANDRVASAEVIVQHIPSDKPLYVMGDWNAAPDEATLRKMREGFTLLSDESPTFPAPRPVQCIDYIAVSKGFARQLKPKTYRVLEEKVLSDHRPILLTFISDEAGESKK